MNVALKEWASVVDALAAGIQICLLRKGGIVETDRGGFHLRERKFLLFPTYEHAHVDLVKPVHRASIREPKDTGIAIALMGEVTDIGEAPRTLESLRRADPYFIWNDAFLAKRLSYKPELPLNWILIRAYRLPSPVTIPNRPSYAGCKSWVHLTEELDESGAAPVLPDDRYDELRNQWMAALSET